VAPDIVSHDAETANKENWDAYPMSRSWWVNHSQTFRYEIDGGYLWSPKTEKNGARSQFYDNMRLASPGDIVISFANALVSYVGCVTDYALAGSKPSEFGAIGSGWASQGWLLPIEWQSLGAPVKPKDHLLDLSSHLPGKYSPIHPQTGNGNQKAYLAEIGAPVVELVASLGKISISQLHHISRKTNSFRVFADQLDDQVETYLLIDQELEKSEKEQVIRARRGQGQFRENVQRIENRCRLTGVNNPAFLMASHIKPWRLCTSTSERLDGNNGLFLTPHVDLLFDRGYISFQDNGTIMVSPRIDMCDLNLLGLINCAGKAVGPFTPEQCVYLAYHRANIFLE
jgi:putative restriction endonuclease